MFEKEAEERITEQFGTSGEYVTRQRIWQDGAEFGYNKANEWHYVKDELPISDKDKYYFVVVDKWNGPMIARFYEGVWSNYSTIEDVIAWKEIVLPKEIKENDL
ncbi:MAG: hypothetical protein IIT65_00210 [Lachnospiraceae bacterium]|nr:hypothetical protein [Lachnospiraceae bacterium]